MEIIIDELKFEFPPQILNEHIIEIGIYELMKVMRGTEGQPNLEKLEGEAKEKALDKIDKTNSEIYPIFLKLLKAVGITDIMELPLITTVKLLQAPEFQEWMKTAFGSFL